MAIIIHYQDGTSEVLDKKGGVSKTVLINADKEGEISNKPDKYEAMKEQSNTAAGNQKKLEEIQVKMGELYRRKQRIANHLVDIHATADNERRKAMCDEMRVFRKEYNALYEKIEHFKLHGFWPVEKKEDKPKLTELEKHELFRKRQNVAANISKAKNMVKKHQHNPAKLVQYQEKQASLEAEIREIDELLGK